MAADGHGGVRQLRHLNEHGGWTLLFCSCCIAWVEVMTRHRGSYRQIPSPRPAVNMFRLEPLCATHYAIELQADRRSKF